jgi:hypothetical protein
VDGRSSTSRKLTCAHNVRAMWRLREGMGRLVGDVAGAWVCEMCHPPAAPLIERGLVEWMDGRVVQLARAPEPVPSEAKGSSIGEQAVPDPVGSEAGQLPALEEPARTAVPAPKPPLGHKPQKKKAAKRKAAEPPSESLF